MADTGSSLAARGLGMATAQSADGPAHSCTIPLPCEQLFRDCAMEDMLGEGRFGTVWRCFSRKTGSTLACKQIERAGTPHDVSREVDCLTRVQGHPNVLALEGVYESETYLYIVTELCNGGDLFDFLGRRGRLSEDEAKEIFCQLVEAVQHCHSRGLIHRDIKPENVLLQCCPATGHVTAKLADFGLAKVLAGGEKATGWVGSEPYEAPEVVALKPYGFPADVFSLGVVLFGLLSGTWPTFLEGKVFNAEADFAWPGWQQISAEARDLISRMLEQDPEARPTTEEILHASWVFPDMLDLEADFYSRALEGLHGHDLASASKQMEQDTAISDIISSWEPLMLSRTLSHAEVTPVSQGLSSNVNICSDMTTAAADLGLAAPEVLLSDFVWEGSAPSSPRLWASESDLPFESAKDILRNLSADVLRL